MEVHVDLNRIMSVWTSPSCNVFLGLFLMASLSVCSLGGCVCCSGHVCDILVYPRMCLRLPAHCRNNVHVAGSCGGLLSPLWGGWGAGGFLHRAVHHFWSADLTFNINLSESPAWLCCLFTFYASLSIQGHRSCGSSLKPHCPFLGYLKASPGITLLCTQTVIIPTP